MVERQQAVGIIHDQLSKAVAARKCHPCGCLHQTLSLLEGTEVGRGELAALLGTVRAAVKPKEYECLGCAVCYPAIASNALSEAFPEIANRPAACPTDVPVERTGWPPLPGDYHVVRYGAPVAVCTLNSETLALRLAQAAPDGLAIVGTLHTENLGIERIIRNIVANPNVRFLIVCGEDSQQAIGHLPGQSLASLFANGIDERGRIRGAQGKRPVLINVGTDEVSDFLRQVEVIPLIGEAQEQVIGQRIAEALSRNPGPFDGPARAIRAPVVQASEPRRMAPDPAGFFVVYPDPSRHRLVVEHYSNAGVLDCIVDGRSSGAIYMEIIDRKLLTRLDHAAYLGQELALAERSMRTGERYVQDRAPGEPPQAEAPVCACSSGGEPGCKESGLTSVPAQ